MILLGLRPRYFDNWELCLDDTLLFFLGTTRVGLIARWGDCGGRHLLVDLSTKMLICILMRLRTFASWFVVVDVSYMARLQPVYSCLGWR